MKRHTRNAEGRFWIDQDVCMICASCFDIAPANVAPYEIDGGSYVFKQPETEEELEAVREAIHYCPVEAIIEDK